QALGRARRARPPEASRAQGRRARGPLQGAGEEAPQGPREGLGDDAQGPRRDEGLPRVAAQVPQRLPHVDQGREAPGPRRREGEEKKRRALGEMRVFIYKFAAGTGLRRGELGRVRWCDVDFDRRLLSVPASSAKSRRAQIVELRTDLLAELKARLEAFKGGPG